jgi:SAM-dependent methyltransferase
MKLDLLKYICCPINHDPFTIKITEKNPDGSVISGKLFSGSGIEYSIQDGIPLLVPRTTDSSKEKSNNSPIYERVTKPYDDYLVEHGIDASKIAQMDSLRYSIYKLSNEIITKYCNGIVLDLGAGRDHLREDYSRLSTYWISLDYDARSNTIDVNGDGQFLPFPDNLFDTIVSIDVLEHVADPAKFISEIYRVLKPSGKVILSTPFFFWLHEEPHDYYRFSRYGLKTIFEKNNFKVIDVMPIAGIVSIIGILISILLVKTFRYSKYLLILSYHINKLIQLNIFYPLDKIIDKRKRFAQGHFIIAEK